MAGGAQRLSASKIGSLRIGLHTYYPVGVLNACRRQRSVHEDRGETAQQSAEVLNACRRQRSVHATPGPGDNLEYRCAQRLSASKIGSPLKACTVISAMGCAQRLSASKIGSLSGHSLTRKSTGVLNACRRQRSVHEHRDDCPVEVHIVLNACRRQRSVHNTMSYDIYDKQRVLNACRRQRSVHNGFPIGSINPISRAQRLSASKIGSRRPDHPAPTERRRAQRLSASKIGSRPCR